MARISREDHHRNKQLLDQTVWELFKQSGWSGLTYSKIAEQMGMSKSTVQGYYPSSADFLEALEGKGLPAMLPKLDLTCPQSFLNSWRVLITQTFFANQFELFVLDAIQGLNGRYAQSGKVRILKFLQETFDIDQQAAEQVVQQAVGIAVFELLAKQQQKQKVEACE
ncbi:TetR/AcrR family transcriptional regulator [Vibrio hippocampi]|uniref:HTH tetR-type domain-containing protein n=1 Tax=Vibrio hippocampi TaxID=654686 RepID=A0ABN8DJN7_9VIBR|nr:TetR/AcrR family transcriptional regulator [Vibrio hippocampi]CAH0526170.1 hypothetical protein VHP8226_01644 [Vibrio hippocampi]